MAEPPVTFAALLRKLRTQAQLTQEELAEATGLSPRSISDLERGIATTPRRETVRLLADALGLTGVVKAQFEAAARGRSFPADTGADGVGGAAAATRTLPRDIASFTGRQHELQELANATADAAQWGGVVSIHAIGGMAGIGKTAFAVHAAHQLADRFPGGQIFLPLHGHTPGQAPVNPADALASLLATLGVPAGQIPPGLEARMALWRDRLAEKQLLLILDDAASRMHDLIREHARALADRLDPDRDRDDAIARLLDYYQYTAARAGALLTRQVRLALAGTVAAIPAAVPALADSEQALAWTRAERASLLACLDHAASTGQHARVTALTAGLAGLLRRDGPWAEAITRHTAAIQAARYLGDQLGQAAALSDLGNVRSMTGDYPGAAEALEQALVIHGELGSRNGQANALVYLGDLRLATGDYTGAAQVLEQALVIYRELGSRNGQANALALLGIVWQMTGDCAGAAMVLEQALGIYRDIGDKGGEAEALNESGTLHRVGGELDQARDAHLQALDLARQMSSAWDEAHALAGLGRCALAAGHTAEAADTLRQALEVFQRIGAAAQTSDLLAELDALAGPPAAP